jgi:GNAT superfamily N-acetyltransferase
MVTPTASRLAGDFAMSDPAIREATLADLDVIAEFNARLAAETEDTALDRATLRAGVRVLLDTPSRGRYYLACAGAAIVGQIMHTHEWSDWRNGDIWWVQSVYIHPEHRRQGVFRALYAHLRALAATTPGVVGLRLYVERENHAAQATYAHLGMDDATYRVMQDLFE